MRPRLRVFETRHPILYEIDTRSWLRRLSRDQGRRVHLGDVPPAALTQILATGCDLVWLMGIWRTGPAGRAASRNLAWLEPEARTIFPDFELADIAGSPYAIAVYEVDPALGGEEGLACFRAQLARAGVGLVLDFVPNHTATDHPWVRRHPEWYVNADRERAEAEPDSWFPVRAGKRTHRIAHGRDPFFSPWRDTAQLDYRVPDLRAAMADVLRQIATRCDAVRCDMAMLVIDDVFCGTWQDRSSSPATRDAPAGEFWWHAIRSLRERYPDVIMIAESYWGLEHRLQQLGFDYTWDKVLLDRLRNGPAEAVGAHLRADPDYQRRSVRFLENHDEPRAASALLPTRQHSAALIAATVPGMLLLHDGQLDGARIRTPVELGRRPIEPPDLELRSFYDRLLDALRSEAFRKGVPVRLEPRATWEGDPTHAAFVAWLWAGPRRSLRLAVANLGPTTGRCFIPLSFPEFAGKAITLEDLLSEVRYVRDGQDLLDRGLFLELPPDGHHLFRIRGHLTPDRD
ncbi:MAG TPA: alpha-amylase family glycosyl hydrolase [Candidatus Saccharimonadales bacterium]|nr:alpha-amylase family glycosyl hydrolase [Candidatus Saccharimonadales bacterium]